LQETENGQKNSTQGRVTPQGTQKHGEPNRADIERMQRLLKKTKNE